MKAEIELIEWITDNGEHSPCTRQEARYGCLMCQELWKIIDNINREVAIEFHVHELKRLFKKLEYTNEHKRQIGINFDKWQYWLNELKTQTPQS